MFSSFKADDKELNSEKKEIKVNLLEFEGLDDSLSGFLSKSQESTVCR